MSEGNADASWRTELRGLQFPQVSLLLAGAIGFGGTLAVYSYIAPTVTEVAGLRRETPSIFLFVFGIGSVLGMWLAGVLADWSVFRALLMGAAGLAVVLALFWVSAHRLGSAACGLPDADPRVAAGDVLATATDGGRR